MSALAASASKPPRSWTLRVGLVLVALHLAVALLTLVWTPYDPTELAGRRLEGPSLLHLAGTDRLGRDLLTQMMIGSRIALLVGTGAVAVGALVGVTLGILAAFASRWLDDALAAALDIMIAFPTLLIAMLVVAVSESASLFTAVLALGLGLSAIFARLTRILAKRVIVLDFVTAACTCGTSWPGIVFGHVLPNIWPQLSVAFALQFGLAVIAEASLSYLGLGAPPPNASWGRLLQEAQGTVFTAPLGAVLPGLALVSLVIGINLLADGLRERSDPRQAGR
ncbi:ABC transporter permease [Aureimonas sp. ME7]|uniref:ABC transporter permease n=1 Tax=Aureimonas sp. ME7 TaxID=2744252 RepID=UPI0015F36700|nr:ABC transporter permease [Aureimonas sp. ME7]